MLLRRVLMAFRVSAVKKGRMLVHGLEAFVERFVERKLKEARIEEKVAELRRALHLDPREPRRAPEEAPAASAPVPVKSAPAPAPAVRAPPPRPAPGPKVPAPRKPAPARAAPPRAASPAAKPKPKPAARPVRVAEPVAQLLGALDAHPQRAAILRAGRGKDQLLRSLIPLYLAQGLEVDVTSGTVTKLWARHGVKFAAPNAAKALREHEGYARRTGAGPLITPNGVKYVEDALAAV
jgi:hypothetical protein